jgi:hypothetical protein
VRDEVAGKVERGDRSNDPARHAQRESELSPTCLRSIHRHHLAREFSRLDRCEIERRHRTLRLDAGRLQRLSCLVGDQPGDLVVPRPSWPATLTRISARLWAGSGSAIARSAASSALRLPSAALGDAADRLPGLGRADLETLAGLDPLAGDEKPALERRCRHVASVGARD